jgi:hypothetical protein
MRLYIPIWPRLIPISISSSGFIINLRILRPISPASDSALAFSSRISGSSAAREKKTFSVLEIPGAFDLWSYGCGPLFVGEVEDRSITQHHGKMDNALDRTGCYFDDLLDGIHIIGFASDRGDGAAHALQFAKEGLVMIALPGTSREEYQMSGTSFYHPSRNRLTRPPSPPVRRYEAFSSDSKGFAAEVRGISEASSGILTTAFPM